MEFILAREPRIKYQHVQLTMVAAQVMQYVLMSRQKPKTAIQVQFVHAKWNIEVNDVKRPLPYSLFH